eukprot:3581116-Pyramimonas_sp.AAC.1
MRRVQSSRSSGSDSHFIRMSRNACLCESGNQRTCLRWRRSRPSPQDRVGRQRRIQLRDGDPRQLNPRVQTPRGQNPLVGHSTAGSLRGPHGQGPRTPRSR